MLDQMHIIVVVDADLVEVSVLMILVQFRMYTPVMRRHLLH